MDRGTYAAASNGMLQMRKVEVVNNNLANINTPGFKKQILVSEEQNFDETFAKEFEKIDPYARGDHERTPGVTNVRAVIDFSQGPVKATGNPLDAALRKENQFFVVQSDEGEQYTRAGNFTLNSEGQMVMPDGTPVLGDGGAITTDGPGVLITTAGIVKGNGQEFGRLRVVEFSDTSVLEQAGGNRFRLKAGGAAPTQVDASVESGAVEMANVSAISSVVELIAANRGFEMYTRTAQSIDQINQAAISQIGKAR